jgi:hypothetical protein
MVEWESFLDDEELLTAYIGDFEISPSDTPHGELANVQRGIDRRIRAQMRPASLTNLPSSVEEIQNSMDSRTAVLQLFEGTWTDGKLATYSLLLTREHEYVSIRLDDLSAGMKAISIEGRRVRLPAGGFFVASVRREVRADPGVLACTRDGADLLHGSMERYLATIFENQDELRASGKDRLVVLPHAALHFLPMHLVGPPGAPLCDEWTVTYLLSPGQLVPEPNRTGAPARRTEAGVYALGYEGDPVLPSLECSTDEARAIASVLRVTPRLDGAATASSFKRALETCRFVHLRAHGQHNLDAPLFQTVYLAPGEGHDGRLHAHEVLPLDLRGLELVTLGACETALGRYDVGDNVHGLPSALLIAGADAVIGTLWEVTPEASTAFFTVLYRHLLEDEDDLVTAFSRAQRTTRKAHPQYRDWGAFTLTQRHVTEAR